MHDRSRGTGRLTVPLHFVQPHSCTMAGMGDAEAEVREACGILLETALQRVNLLLLALSAYFDANEAVRSLLTRATRLATHVGMLSPPEVFAAVAVSTDVCGEMVEAILYVESRAYSGCCASQTVRKALGDADAAWLAISFANLCDENPATTEPGVLPAPGKCARHTAAKTMRAQIDTAEKASSRIGFHHLVRIRTKLRKSPASQEPWAGLSLPPDTRRFMSWRRGWSRRKSNRPPTHRLS